MEGVTNSFNPIDGIDGLADGLALISMIILGWLSYQLKINPLFLILCSFEVILIILAAELPYAASISLVILILVFCFHFITIFLRVNQGVEDLLKIVKQTETGIFKPEASDK
jgi:UDP-N-acetylmuramyl pentapeptide phosphotransferase/UDP-N-acetylglucosamine-1-phosphate transferase